MASLLLSQLDFGFYVHSADERGSIFIITSTWTAVAAYQILFTGSWLQTFAHHWFQLLL